MTEINKLKISYQCNNGVDGSIEAIAEGSHAFVGVGVVIAQYIVL